jgi:hypothetical protein
VGVNRAQGSKNPKSLVLLFPNCIREDIELHCKVPQLNVSGATPSRSSIPALALDSDKCSCELSEKE